MDTPSEARQDGLPATMKAVVCHGIRDYRYEEIATPVAGEEEVIIKVKAVGICASDAKCYDGAPLFWGDADRVGYCQPPITPGHEFIGEVVVLGPGAAAKYGLAIGDHVVSEQIVPCWTCVYCNRGKYHLCLPHEIYGFRTPTPGAMAQYLKFPKGAINHKVPTHVPWHHAAFIEPLACGIHAVNRGDIEFGHVVVVAGAGSLGLGMIAAARQKNPKLLIALDFMDWKLDIAKACGADLVLNPTKCDVLAEVRKLTEGVGCDVYIEATGHPSAVTQGIHMMAKGGTFVEYSVFAKEVSLDWTIIGDTKELNIHGGHLGPHCYPKAIDMIANGHIPMDLIVTHQFPLEQVEEGIKLVLAGKESVKIVLIPPE